MCETVAYLEADGSMQIVTYDQTGEDVEAVWLTAAELQALGALITRAAAEPLPVEPETKETTR